jgi:hypothetical protein
MKKNLLLIAAVLFTASYSRAQESFTDTREKFQIGIKIGANVSNVYDSKGEVFNSSAKLGLAGGGFLSIPIGKYFGIQPEILLSQKGFRATGTYLGTQYDLTRTSTFIDIPILFAIKPTALITLMLGPQYSYLIRQTDVFSSGGLSTIDDQAFNSNIRKNIFCFLGGLDINLNHLVFGGRVGWDIIDNNGDGTSTIPRYKNVWYQATVGLRFE